MTDDEIRQQIADEDAGLLPNEDLDFPPLPDLPEAPDDVVAVIVPFTKRTSPIFVRGG